MLKIGIILASVRDGRRGGQVAQWVAAAAARRTDAEFELIDLLDHPLPHLETEKPALLTRGAYEDERTLAWAAVIAPCDGYVIVTPEYNHSMPGSLKNAIDHLYVEWNDKAVGFVSYGVDGGVRSVAQLRQLCGVLQLADVAVQVSLTLAGDFEQTVLAPRESQARTLDLMLDHVVRWSGALAPLRAAGSAGAAESAESAESEIRARISGIVDGIAARDLDALRRIYAPEVVSFDVESPLQHVGVDAKLKNWAKVFTVFADVSYELRDLTVEVGGDIGFCHAFGRISGHLTANGEHSAGMWVRATFCFRRIDGDWLIVHDQASMPVDVLTGRVAVGLEP